MTDSTPAAQQFTLDRSRAGAWLRGAPEPGTEAAWADDAWDPGVSGQENAVLGLVSGAVDAGIIGTPRDTGIRLEYAGDPNSDYYYFLVQAGNGRLRLASDTQEMRKIGEAGVTGIPAALAVLAEAVRAGNAALGGLDEIAAERAAHASAAAEDDGLRAANGIVLTGEQISAWAGFSRELTGDELARLEDCIPNSSIPDAIDTIVSEALQLRDEEEEEDPFLLYYTAAPADREAIRERGLEPEGSPGQQHGEKSALARRPEHPAGDVWEITADPANWYPAGTAGPAGTRDEDRWVSFRPVPPRRLRLVHEAAARSAGRPHRG